MRVSFVVFVLSVLYGLRGEEDCNRFKHGQSWKEDCQTCTCFDGTILCTGELCKPPEFDYETTCNDENKDFCSSTNCEYDGVTYKHGQYIKMGCKRCLCFEGKFKNSCQRDADCEEIQKCSEEGREYSEGEVWMSKCQICSCRAGKNFCTFNKECSLSCNVQSNRIRNQQFFRWGCQRCLCNNGIVLCTADPKERGLC